MKLMKLPFCLAIALAVASCSPSKPKPTPGAPVIEPPPVFMPAPGVADANDIARFLAGKPVHRGAALSQLQLTGSYKRYADDMRYRWQYYSSRRTSRQSQWSDEQIAPLIGSPSTLLYPFGGPDLLHAIAMFPETSTYVLLGLEPAGGLPALESQDPNAVLAALPQLSKSMDTQLKVGYFITKDMRADLNNGALQGVSPILLSSIGLLNGTVQSVQPISAAGNAGIDIRFRIPGGGSRRVIYISGDLSNSGFSSGYQSWLKSFGGSVAYFKAASYLMHDNRFSNIRNFVLNNTRAVLQDDSGIPYRYFAGWQTQFFGNYEAPIELFAKHVQNDLRDAYNVVGPVPAIPFGSGYHTRASNANLQLYRKGN